MLFSIAMQYRTKKIREARIRRGWSQTQLAKIVDLTPQAISAIESGKIKGLPATIKAIADALNLDMGDLIILDDNAA